MTILLLGANGQVGHELRRSLAPLGNIVATTRSGELPDGGRCEIADFDRPDTLAELVQRNQEDMMKVRNLGKKSLEEVEQKLAALGLALRANDE